MNVFRDLYGDKLYSIFTIYLSSAALLLYNLAHVKIKRNLLSEISQAILSHHAGNGNPKISQIRTLLVIAEIVLISLFQHGLVSLLNHCAGSIFQTGTNYFGMIIAMPLLLPALCWLIGVDPFKQIDLITPAYPLALFFMKLGCFFSGCCSGIMCNIPTFPWPIEFPIQLLEALVALIIFFFLIYHKKRAAEGTLLPIYILLYCSVRFFTEFLRSNPNILWSFQKYHFLCLFGILYSTAQLVIIRKYREKISCIYRNSFPHILSSSKQK